MPQARNRAARRFYKWKAKYGGLEVSDAKRLKALEDENAKLKTLLVEAELDKAMLKEIASKNGSARRLRYVGGSAPRPVALPSRQGSNDAGTLLIGG